MSADDSIRRKLVIIGDGATGKTSLLCVFVLGEFPSVYHPTIFDNHEVRCILDGKTVDLRLWDTAGQEEFDGLRPLIYSRSDVILVAFAVDNRDSLESARTKWITEAKAKCPQAAVFLVGLKTDLRTNDECLRYMEQTGDHCVTKEEAQSVANEIGVRQYLECSALSGEGVDDLFERAVRASLVAKDTETSRCCLIL